ncbi:dosage compensation regulator-like [Adelges cooleyi]|uniref:dosage compensation regulator-like n=1 Tax=Adelges cooleyi TaxID=133065 RepID=UPI00218081BD|nr:dosage compensation regulator-like [Adelges cooleyi]
MPERKTSKSEKLLNQWCAQNNLNPKFNFHHDDMKNNYNQICKLTVPGHDYVAIGVSKKRKHAISQCCTDFMEYLEKELGLDRKALSGIKEPLSKCTLIEPTSVTLNAGDKEYVKIVEKIKLKNIYIDETDCLDANANKHGNWTSDIAKKNLMIYTKLNEIKNCDFKYATIEKKCCYTAKISVYIKLLDIHVAACQPGKSKLAASNRCSLSVIRQLFHMDIVEGYSSSMSSTEKSDILHKKKSYKVNVDQQLVDRVYDVLDKFSVEPVIKKDDILEAKRSFSLIPDVSVAEYREFKPSTAAKVVQWIPPMIDVDPWRRNSNISSYDTLDEMSEDLSKQFNKHFHNSSLSKSLSKCNKLPIYSRAIEILDAIEKNPVVIIEGSTGCGKTTQVSQLILDDHLSDNKGAYCNIICTQPRKLSAISVANRIASERGETLGQSVGYAVRFEHVFPRSHGSILVCTDGILMRRLEYGLHGISHIIVDEIHERHADTDFLMIVLKDMVEKYPDIRIILMSATIDIELFSSYFNDCPIITIKGTCHPIKEFFLEDIIKKLDFQPNTDKKKLRRCNKKTNGENCNLFVSDDYPEIVRERVAMIPEDDQHFELVEALLASIDAKEQPENRSGAVLIFLPGWDWIAALRNYLSKKALFASPRFLILPLHSKLPTSEQEKVFQKVPPGVRKLILTTNIAETSITIEDIVYVIDYGKARMNVFTPLDNTINFVTVWVSKANKRQRMGRAGRVKPGYCFHLCSKARYDKLDDHIVPELTRLPLIMIGLGIKLLKLGDIGSYLSRAIQPPPMKSVVEAESILKSMKCLGDNLELTSLGLIAARQLLWPKLTRMIVLASFFKLGDPLSIVAAVHSDQCELFIQDQGVPSVKQSFSKNYCSDQIATLNAFYQWQYMHRNDINDWGFCSDNMLSWGSLMSAHNIKKQIQQRMINSGFPKECYRQPDIDFEHDTAEDSPDLDLLPAILTAGFYPNVCCHDFGRVVNLKDKLTACIHRSSVNCEQNKKTQFPSPFFVFADRLQTGALFCMQMTMVTPIHLLLFGAVKIEYTDDCVVLDDWIRLDMDVKSAAAIVALRPIIEEIMVRAVEQPECILRRTEADRGFIQILRDLCNFNAGTHDMPPIELDQKNHSSCTSDGRNRSSYSS